MRAEAVLLWVVSVAAQAPLPTPACNGTRVPPALRRFNSTAVDALIARYRPQFRSHNISRLFENCLPNCLDSTVVHASAEDTFIITGDIPAMWLRDATNQLLPYVRLSVHDPPLQRLVCGTIQRQASQVITNRYANAFNMNPSAAGHKTDQGLS